MNEPTSPAAAPPGPGYAGLDDLVTDFQQSGGAPGVAYGVVAGGELVHAGGAGQRWLGGPAPDAGTVFRIASMTKSFTAAAVLALRDDGRLRLDDAAAGYVPELDGLRPVSPDAPVITIRHLLTMTAGFPTDDPWGDRQQALPLDEFARLVRGGLRPAWAPGTQFEYANLGYALLGRVVAAAAGTGYREFVATRLFQPLGLDRTGFEAATVAVPAELAHGHQRHDADWAEVALDGYGAFAPMGGIFSCVRDLARWVGGFTAAFPPGAEELGGPHPLSRATRREMQLAQVLLPATGGTPLPGADVADGAAGYGLGLFVTETAAWGRLVFHSGGYPGFGSHMRWHPDTGLGVIVLANATYARASWLAARLMESVLRGAAGARPSPSAVREAPGTRPSPSAVREAPGARPSPSAVRGPAPAPGRAWPETLAAQQAADQLLRSWDDEVAGRLFAANVALDEPYARRQQRARLLWQRLGPPAGEPPRPPEHDSPAHCRWWLAGEQGTAQAEIKLTAEQPPRVQLLAVTVPPARDGWLWQRTQALVALLNALPNGPSPGWPADLPVARGTDTGRLLRRLTMAAAWAGPVRPGAWCGGNGESSTAIDLDGAHGRLTLSVEIDPSGQLRHLDLAIPT